MRSVRSIATGRRLPTPELKGLSEQQDLVTECPRLHRGPLLVNHRSRIADELAREAGTDGDRDELCRLELLSDDLRFRLASASRRVEALEGEEDDEPQQHGEPGREHAEHA